MAMKKAEMEAAQAEYDDRIASARAAIRQGNVHTAIRRAREAWPHAEGMMRYGRKYESKEYDSLACIEIIVKYAPLVFDIDSIQEFAETMTRCKWIEKNTATNLGETLRNAHDQTWRAHRLWNLLESEGPIRQDDFRTRLGGNQDEWRHFSEQWEELGLAHRVPISNSYLVSLVTQMGERWLALCETCGAEVAGAKRRFLDECVCPGCGRSGRFILRGSRPNAEPVRSDAE